MSLWEDGADYTREIEYDWTGGLVYTEGECVPDQDPKNPYCYCPPQVPAQICGGKRLVDTETHRHLTPQQVERVRDWCLSKRRSIASLAREIEVSPNQLSAWMGRRYRVPVEILGKLLAVVR